MFTHKENRKPWLEEFDPSSHLKEQMERVLNEGRISGNFTSIWTNPFDHAFIEVSLHIAIHLADMVSELKLRTKLLKLLAYKLYEFFAIFKQFL